MKLRWEMKRNGSWWAHSGKLIIGYVTVRMDGTVGYSVTAVSTKYVTKGYGTVKTVKYGKRAVERAWRQWLEAAGIYEGVKEDFIVKNLKWTEGESF